MGRFARSNDISRARAQAVEPRASIKSWINRKPARAARRDRRSKLEQLIFKLALAVALIAFGVFSGWKTGKLIVGPSETTLAQPAAIVGSLPSKDSLPNQTAQVLDEDEGKSSDPETQESRHEAEAAYGQAAGADGARRHSKGEGFEPTSIVTKSVKIMSKPIKKLNPLKLF